MRTPRADVADAVTDQQGAVACPAAPRRRGQGPEAPPEADGGATPELFAASAVHEINNPISAILAHAQFLLKTPLAERQRADVERIAAEALRASRILQNLLTLARPAPARQDALDINRALAQALDLRARELAAHRIATRTMLSPDLPPVAGDASRLEQVFVNLINNARDAMLASPGDRLLAVATEAVDGRVRITFEDTGAGVPPECLERIFDPFFTTKPAGRGAGLGLAVCRRIITEHGGCVSAHNPPGGGARFTIELPAAETLHDR